MIIISPTKDKHQNLTQHIGILVRSGHPAQPNVRPAAAGPSEQSLTPQGLQLSTADGLDKRLEQEFGQCSER